MIVFDLHCDQGHTFEAWFPDLNSFEKQMQEGLISCPECGNSRVAKLPSRGRYTPAGPTEEDALRRVLASIYEYVEKNTVDVGTSFARKALEMHYGVIEPGNIRGVATGDEEETLRKEGISFMKVPVPKKPNSSGH